MCVYVYRHRFHMWEKTHTTLSFWVSFVLLDMIFSNSAHFPTNAVTFSFCFWCLNYFVKVHLFICFLCACVCGQADVGGCPRGPEEGVGSLGIGVTDSCELCVRFNMGAENWSLVLCKSSKCSYLPSHLYPSRGWGIPTMCESNGAGSFSLGCNPHHVIQWLLAVKLAEQCDQMQIPLRFPGLLGDPNTMASNRECRASGCHGF